MSDNLTLEQRKRTMASVKSKDTTPEKKVRSLVHSLGFRYRLHRKDLPGNPDLVFPRLKKIIFVHGCFWHGHDDCQAAERPASNKSYWNQKLDKNKKRDKENQKKLHSLGWQYLIVWECQMKDSTSLKRKIINFLNENYGRK